LAVNFLLSFSFSRNTLSGGFSGFIAKAAATTHQSQGHLPASSIQILYFCIFILLKNF
jgi:hypothetical protein